MLTAEILSAVATDWRPTYLGSSNSCTLNPNIAHRSDLLPIIISDDRYEVELTDIEPGKAERLFGSPYDGWTDDQLLAKFLQEREPAEAKYDVVPVPGFFRVPREGDDEEDTRWRDSEGNILQTSFKRSYSTWEEHNAKLDAFTKKAKELGWRVATIQTIRHAETLHNLSAKQFPELHKEGLHQVHLASIDTPITTPRTTQTDPHDPYALDGESQLEQTKNLIMKNVENGMKLYPMAFATPHLRTLQTHAGTLGSRSDVVILPNNREQTGSHISDRHGPLSRLRKRYPNTIISPDASEYDTVWQPRRVLNRLGLYAERNHVPYGDTVTVSRTPEETEKIKALVSSTGSDSLDGISQLSDKRWHREHLGSVTRRSRLADEEMFDLLTTANLAGAANVGHGTSLHCKLSDWDPHTHASWPKNSDLDLETLIDSFEEHQDLLIEYKDSKRRRQPTKLDRAEFRPVVVLYRLKEGNEVDSTLGNLWTGRSKGTNGSGDGTCLYSIKLPECTTT